MRCASYYRKDIKALVYYGHYLSGWSEKVRDGTVRGELFLNTFSTEMCLFCVCVLEFTCAKEFVAILALFSSAPLPRHGDIYLRLGEQFAARAKSHPSITRTRWEFC